jgi:hypothetical protein
MARLREVLPGDSGPELFEWIAVTLILTLAFLVLLQVVGPHVQQALDWLSGTVRGLGG